MDKILYNDGDKPRLLKGYIMGEDEHFIKIELDQGSQYRINKKSIISIRQGESSGKTTKDNKY